MDFMSLYNTLESYYEIGMTYDIKAYFGDNKYVKNYSLNYIGEEYRIEVDFRGEDIRQFVYDFFSYIVYDDFSMIHKIVENNEDAVYYIYTKLSDETAGIKIKLNIKSFNIK